MKQLILATLVAIFALTTPCIAGAAEFNAPVDSNPDSSNFRHDSMGGTAFSHPEADPKKGAGLNDADSTRSPHPPRWTVSAETIIFDRVGTANRTLVERIPGVVSFGKVPTTSGTPALNSTDLNQGFSPGFRLGLTCHVDSNYGLELSFFRVSGWDCTRSIGPDNPPNWLVMRAPGSHSAYMESRSEDQSFRCRTY